jgi:hypothetical protein
MRSLRIPSIAILCAWMTACSSAAYLRPYVAPDAAARTTAPRVAVLPPAFTLQIDAAAEVSEADRQQMQREVESNAMRLVIDALKQRGFDPSTVGLQKGEDAIHALAQGFVYHANTVAAGAPEGGTFDPALLAKVAPGADAVLYLNGSAVTVSAGRRAEQAAVVLTVAVVIAAVAVLVLLAATKGTGGSHPGTPGGVHAAVPVQGGPAATPLRPGEGFRPNVGIDFYTPIWWAPGPVVGPIDVESPPPRADRSLLSGAEVRLFATLVDVATGKVLWHVDRALAASADDPGQLRDTLIDAFDSLPPRLAAHQ